MSTPSHAPARSRRALVALGTALAAVFGLAASSSAATVEVHVDGDVHAVRAYGGTVDAVLDRLDVSVGPADEISLDPRTPVESDLTVEVQRAITVDVEIHGAVARRVTAPVSSVAGVLEAAELGDLRDTGAQVVPAWNAAVHDGDTVKVHLPTEVTVLVDGEERQASTLASTVEGVLLETGVELRPDDVVLPAESGQLLGPTTITVQRVDISEETEEVLLPHGEQRRESSDLERGTTRVEREGRDGVRIDTFRVVHVDGVLEERERIGERIVRDARDRVVLVGTKEPPRPAPRPAPRATSASSGSSSGGSASGSGNDGVWDRLAQCESNGNWSAVSSNGLYYGGLQFHPQTWRSVGGTGMPHQASRSEQIERGKILQQRSGWGQWPACSRKLGLR